MRHDAAPSGRKGPSGLRFIDMRKGIDGLSMLVQGILRLDPFSGHLFVFRGRTSANLIKIVFWDGTGLIIMRPIDSHAMSTGDKIRESA